MWDTAEEAAAPKRMVFSIRTFYRRNKIVLDAFISFNFISDIPLKCFFRPHSFIKTRNENKIVEKKESV